MIITDHGAKRLRKRLGLNKRSVEKAFGDALLHGRKHSEFKGRFKRYLDGKAKEHQAEPIIYGQNIYWKIGSKLITVYQVPSAFRKYL